MHWADNSAAHAGFDLDYAVETADTNAALDLVQPERNLLLAVLTDAIQRYRRLGTIHGARRRELNESADWILSEDRRWPYSFVNVCEALGIEPSRLRRAVVEGRFSAATIGCEDPAPLLLRRQVTEKKRLIGAPRARRVRKSRS